MTGILVLHITTTPNYFKHIKGTLRSVRMWGKGTNDKYRTVISKVVNWTKIDRLAKCIYSELIEIGSSFLRLTNLIVWDWITIWVYWYNIGNLVLDSYVGTMALYWGNDQGLLLFLGLIAKHHRYETGFRYDTLRWISNWERTI